MVKLNVLEIMQKKNISKYKLFNKLNTIRITRDEKSLNYKSFSRVLEQDTKSIRYVDIDDLCEILDCDISDLLIRE